MKNVTPFYALVKNHSTGKVEPYNIIPVLQEAIFDPKGRITKKLKVFDVKADRYVPVTTKSRFRKFVDNILRTKFWSRCEYEFIVVDWPYKGDSIRDNRPHKLDIYSQVKPNIPYIVDILWKEIVVRLTKLYNEDHKAKLSNN